MVSASALRIACLTLAAGAALFGARPARQGAHIVAFTHVAVVDVTATSDSAGEPALAAYLANGITAVRDLGGPLPELLRWRAEISAGERRGPRLLVADSLGAIAPGQLADLVLLNADPLRDIHNTTYIRAVVANGRLLSRADLDRLLEQSARDAGRSFEEDTP